MKNTDKWNENTEEILMHLHNIYSMLYLCHFSIFFKLTFYHKQPSISSEKKNLKGGALIYQTPTITQNKI